MIKEAKAMKKKSLPLFVLSLSALCVGGAVGIASYSPTLEAKAEGESTSLASSSEATSSSSITSEGSSSSSGDVLDDINKKYDDLVRDKYIFGISLGALISLGISVLWEIIKYMWEHKWKNAVKANSENSVNAVNLIDKKIDQYDVKIQEVTKEKDVAIEAITQKYEEALLEYKEWSEKMVDTMNESAAKLEKYAELEKKVTAIFALLDAYAQTPEGVKMGLAEKIAEIKKEMGYVE